MGIPQAVSQNVGKFFATGEDQKGDYQALIINLTTWPFFPWLALFPR